MNEKIPRSLSGNCVCLHLYAGVLMYASVFACKQPSVMTGSAVWGQIKMSSRPAHFHSHLSADLWKAMKADMVCFFGPWWACLPNVDPVGLDPTHRHHPDIHWVFRIPDLALVLNLTPGAANSCFGCLICLLLQSSILRELPPDSQTPLPSASNSPLTSPPLPPLLKTITSSLQSVLAKAGTACHGEEVSGAPRGCGIHSGRGDPMLKGCQLGFCHGWCVLKTCHLLCLRTGLSEAVKCSHFSLLVPCFFRCCADRSVTSSLFQGGKSTLLCLPCHWFPGHVLKERMEPVVVSACLIEIWLGSRNFFADSFLQFYDLIIFSCKHLFFKLIILSKL